MYIIIVHELLEKQNSCSTCSSMCQALVHSTAFPKLHEFLLQLQIAPHPHPSTNLQNLCCIITLSYRYLNPCLKLSTQYSTTFS